MHVKQIMTLHAFQISQPSAKVTWAVKVAVRVMSSYDVVGEDVVTIRARMPIRNIRLISCLKCLRGRRCCRRL